MGEPDAGWGSLANGLTAAGAGTDTRANALAPLGDGTFVVAGQAADGPTKLLVARYAGPTGALTAGWGSDPAGYTLREVGDGGTAIGAGVAAASGKIVAAGSAVDARRTKTFAARFNAGDGAPDASWERRHGHHRGRHRRDLDRQRGDDRPRRVGPRRRHRVRRHRHDDQTALGHPLPRRRQARHRLRPGGGTPPGAGPLAAAGQPAYGNILATQYDGKILLAGRVGDGDGETLAAARFCSTDTQTCTGTGGSSGVTPEQRPPFKCGKVVKFGLIEAEGCFTENKGVFRATGRLLVNGFFLQPEARSEIVLDIKAHRLYIDGPGVKAGEVSARLGSITIFENLPLDVRLPSLSTPRIPLPDLTLSKRGNVNGFPLTGKADLALVRAGIELTAQVGLPKLFGGMRADMKNGFRPDGLRITARDAKLGPLRVKDLLISYQDSERLWECQATVFLMPFPYGAQGGVAIKNGALKTLVAGVDGLNISVGPGVFLQRISFGIGVDPFTIIGGVGFTTGPQVGGASAVRIDGNFRLAFPGNPFARLEVSSDVFCQVSACSPGAEQKGGDGLKVFNLPLGDAPDTGRVIDLGFGDGGSLVVDQDGTAHVVGTELALGRTGDAVLYCQLPRGQKRCRVKRRFLVDALNPPVIVRDRSGTMHIVVSYNGSAQPRRNPPAALRVVADRDNNAINAPWTPIRAGFVSKLAASQRTAALLRAPDCLDGGLDVSTVHNLRQSPPRLLSGESGTTVWPGADFGPKTTIANYQVAARSLRVATAADGKGWVVWREQLDSGKTTVRITPAFTSAEHERGKHRVALTFRPGSECSRKGPVTVGVDVAGPAQHKPRILSVAWAPSSGLLPRRETDRRAPFSVRLRNDTRPFRGLSSTGSVVFTSTVEAKVRYRVGRATRTATLRQVLSFYCGIKFDLVERSFR